MGERQHGFAWFIVVTAALGASATACSKEEPPPASAASVGQGQVFTFAPPDGTAWVRTDKKMEEVAIVGEPIRRTENEELRWRTKVERKGDEYRVKQDLTYISLARDGETLAQGNVPEGISATLLIDRQGNLTGVKGLEKTAETLRSLVTPGKEAAAEKLITADTLSDIVAARYKVLFGDTIGRPATPGSSWTINNPPGSLVASKTVTVTGHEPCGSATCARLQVDFKMDPRVVARTGVSMVRQSVSAAGENPSNVTVQNSTYEMKGWMLVEPATMLSHGASLTEGGTVTVADPSKNMVKIEIKGSTELSYSYENENRTSQRAPWSDSHVARE